jgi:hypothetical protein
MLLTLLKSKIRSIPCGLISNRRSKLYLQRGYKFATNQNKRAPPEIPKTDEIISEWDQFSGFYTQRVERSVSVANLSLLNMLKIQNASRIIETACGSG